MIISSFKPTLLVLVRAFSMLCGFFGSKFFPPISGGKECLAIN